MDDCGVMSAMTATTGGRAKFDFQAETCFLQASQHMGTATTPPAFCCKTYIPSVG